MNMQKRTLILLLLSSSLYAASSEVEIYQEPNSKSQIVGKVDLHHGVIPIYSKKNWIEIGDPRNGHVGWIPREKLKDTSHTALGMTPLYKTIIKQHDTDPSHKKIYRTSPFTTTTNAPDKKIVEALMKDMESQEKNIRNDMRQIMSLMRKNLGEEKGRG
jgi:hypothetical protein